jgi:hypothetical protein
MPRQKPELQTHLHAGRPSEAGTPGIRPGLGNRPKSFHFLRDAIELLLSDVALLVFFAVTWTSPFAYGARAPHACMAILIMEFITVHSTTFLLTHSGPRKAIFIALLYIPFVAFAGMLARATWPIVTFGWHVYGTLSAFTGDCESRSKEAIIRWAICFALIMLCLAMAAILPWPELGWSEETTPEFAWSRGDDEIVYHITPAWGTLYFFGLTVADALLLKKRYA